jgi:TATA-box binding protein (TBP) (component of TFIID and TFIIIB)
MIKDADFQPVIQNMVATPNFEQPINLEVLSQTTRPSMNLNNSQKPY